MPQQVFDHFLYRSKELTVQEKTVQEKVVRGLSASITLPI